MIIAAYIATIIYSCLSGINDGILYGRKGADSFSWNEHIILIFIRGSLPVFLFIKIGNVDLLFVSACYVLHYSFFHNGFYHITRAKMDGRYRYWRAFSDYSITDTSWMNFRFAPRTIMCILSIVLFVYFNLHNL